MPPPTITSAEILREEKPETVEAAQLPTVEPEEITCPNCGAKAKVDWTAKRVIWE
jgi:hypothetical protein